MLVLLKLDPSVDGIPIIYIYIIRIYIYIYIVYIFPIYLAGFGGLTFIGWVVFVAPSQVWWTSACRISSARIAARTALTTARRHARRHAGLQDGAHPVMLVGL